MINKWSLLYVFIFWNYSGRNTDTAPFQCTIFRMTKLLEATEERNWSRKCEEMV
jgi:hypothetical protein